MPRPKRINHANCWYFILNKGTIKKQVFCNETLKTYFLKQIETISKKYQFDVHSYCITDNTYMMLIQTKKPNLSTAIAVLNAQYSKYFNLKRKKEGPIFKERFKSILIEDESCLINLTRYIHLYPVQEFLTKKPDDYQWSSCKIFINPIQSENWIKTELINTLMSGNYMQFLKKGNPQQILTILGAKRLPRKL